jgi:signal transduction histidine kinase/sensor domain CHASE-containing protein
MNRRYIPVLLMLGAGTFLSIIGCLTVWNWEQERLQSSFQNQADKVTTAIQRSIDSNLEILEATGKLYAASGTVEREEFKIFVEDFLVRYPSLRAMNWTRRIPLKERSLFEKAIRAEGFPNFEIKDRDAGGMLISARRRPEYFPITYVEPFQKDNNFNKAFGFDLGSDPMRRQGLKKARDTGKMIATGAIKIVTTDQLGFLTLLPIYRKNQPINTVSLRRENFQGFITGVFQIADIIEASLSDLELENIDFYLFDNSGYVKDNFLSYYKSSTKKLISEANKNKFSAIQSASGCLKKTTCARNLKVADRQWLLLILPTSEYTAIQSHWGALTTLAIGLLLTSILTIYVLISLRHTFQVEQLVRDRTAQAKQLRETLQELQQTQSQLIQTEKMSSLGQMVAGVAHEINNPVNFIYGNITHADEYIQQLLELLRLYHLHCKQTTQIEEYAEAIDLDFLIADLPKMLFSMKIGADRIRQIVLSLRNFSRLDESEMKQVDIHEGIDSTLLILQHRLKAKSDRPAIEILKQYDNLPPVECYAGQMNQVFMNILSNAIEALEIETGEKGLLNLDSGLQTFDSRLTIPTIKIRTEILKPNYVRIIISDNGPGITEEVRKRLFDPFFTTKAPGKGTGLGLSITYQIVVEKHGGSIQCLSKPGEGAEFSIEIPVSQSRQQGN